MKWKVLGTEGNDINQAKRNLAGFGTTTAAIAAGGETPSPTANTESWNGSSWTEVNNLNTARGALGGSGSNTNRFFSFWWNIWFRFSKTESWNGTAWTEVADLATYRLITWS